MTVDQSHEHQVSDQEMKLDESAVQLTRTYELSDQVLPNKVCEPSLKEEKKCENPEPHSIMKIASASKS